MDKIFANIIIDISHEKVDRPFQYRIPEHLQQTLVVGMEVMIPFGIGDTVRKGYVIEITKQAEFPVEKMKEVLKIVEKDINVDSELIQLAAWMKEYYGSTMINALKTVLPVKRNIKEVEKRELVLTIGEEEAKELLEIFQKKHAVARFRLMQELLVYKQIPYELATKTLHIGKSTIDYFVEQKIIRLDSRTLYRNPIKKTEKQTYDLPLSEEQELIIQTIEKDRANGKYLPYYIHGITGSGKTEVYMSLIANVIQEGKQAILLIPEIALTHQTVMRFVQRFGNRVTIMNSRLSEGERYDQMQRAKKGEVDIMIGPRSALFTPFANLGMIIIDEEHENSYKSDTMPKYHAREVAFWLGNKKDISIVLGSATPSLEMYYACRQHKIKLFELTKRLTGGCLPNVTIEDLRLELKEGNRSIFSRRLQELILDRIQKGQQIMLFLNRRGYAGFISCRSCGHVMKCPNCDVSLSEHNNNKLTCHYCGYSTPKVTKCPECGSPYIMGLKAGTQQIEEAIQKQFPMARVLRMDGDTTKRKDSYEKILEAFSNKEADILVGTQMIVKGHDFSNVTLVGILAADLSLAANDYHASERTFQLLTQAAGRAGRGTLPGEVVIQTYQPEHYSIQYAAKQDFKAFYEEEILYRELMSYPPVANMLAVLVYSKEENTGLECIQKLIATIAEDVKDKKAIVIGPTTATIAKINNVYRFLCYIKHKDYQELINIKNLLEIEVENCNLVDVMVQFDFNPVNTY